LADTLAPPTIASFTAGDGYVWRYRRFPAAGEPRAHIVGIHGIQSHGGWYEWSCGRLAQAGFEVSFLDRRGSGLNERARGDCPSFRRLLDDIAEFVREERKVGRKVFLMAISWGGKLAVAFPRRHPGLVDGLALLCPGMCPRIGLPFGQRMTILGSRLVNPGKLFDIPLSDPALFTANPIKQQFIREDKVGLRQATARFLLESARLDGFLRWFAPQAVTMPVLMLLAEHDQIIDNAATRRYLERCPTREKQIIEYPGTHHTLEFEAAPEQFLQDLQRWLTEQCSRPE
jgi:alpha-beta hydrolase superfamily lysophospholipase